MAKKNNIDDLFGRRLRDEPYPLRPSERVWQGIMADRAHKRRMRRQKIRDRAAWSGLSALLLAAATFMGSLSDEEHPAPRDALRSNHQSHRQSEHAASPGADRDPSKVAYAQGSLFLAPTSSSPLWPRRSGWPSQSFYGAGRISSSPKPVTLHSSTAQTERKKSHGSNTDLPHGSGDPTHFESPSNGRPENNRSSLHAGAQQATFVSASTASLRHQKGLAEENAPLQHAAKAPLTTEPFDTSRSLIQKPQKWSVALSYGHGKLESLWENASAEDAAAYARMRQATEQQEEVEDFNLQVGYQWASGWHIYTGVSYTHWQGRASRQNQKVRTDTFQNIDSISVLLPGNEQLWLVDTTQFTRDTVLKHAFQSTHTYQRVQLPLLIGYRQPLSRKLGLEFMAGVRMTLWQRESGRVADYQSWNATQPLDQQYAQGMHLQGQGTLDIYYQVFRHWQFTAGATYRRHWNNVLASEIAAEQKFSVFGVHSGIRFSF